MASAAARTSRKPPARSPRAGEPNVPIPEIAGGWMAFPIALVEAFPCCTRIEYGIIVRICQQTIGANKIDSETGERPEWAAFSEREFAVLTGCTSDGVHKALRSLLSLVDGEPTKQSLIQARGGNGVRREYRLLLPNFRSRHVRPLREINLQRETDPGGDGLPIRRGVPATIEIGRHVPSAEFQSNSDGDLQYTVDDDGALSLSFTAAASSKKTQSIDGQPRPSTTGEKQNRNKGDPAPSAPPGPMQLGASGASHSNPPSAAAARAGDRGPNTPDSALRGQLLREFLTPIFQTLLRRVPEPAFIRQVARHLGNASVEHYRELVIARLKIEVDSYGRLTINCRDKRSIASGLFLNFADDARKAALTEPRPKGPAQNPDVGQRHALPSISEPESSGSPWMRIRLEVKSRVDPIAYNNWFLPTASDRYDPVEQELHVITRDAPVAYSLQYDFAAVISDAIADLRLPLRRIVYHAADTAHPAAGDAPPGRSETPPPSRAAP